MAKNLIIVESPAKAKTIENYLGAGYEVEASIGHISDLPEKELGVDLEHNFTPTYQIIPGKEKVVSKLKSAAKRADNIYLASDPDREGEAIAWHINEEIKGVNKPIQRVMFNEITKQGVKDALNNPGKIDMNLVNSQQSRRILDRIVGYKVSPLLWRPLKYGLSAGRVQSVALRIICEREDEISKFITEESWSLDLAFDVFDGNTRKGALNARLDKKDGKTFELKTEAETDSVIKELQNAEFKITDVQKKTINKTAPLPFITARLQQDAIRKLGFTAKKTMRVAQDLYEGIALADGSEGLITYMRTDSTRISKEAADAAANYITATYGKEYLGKGSGSNKGKAGANVQDAHEAIRPTVATRTPDSIKRFLSADQYKLYKLIWERFIASQMAKAVYEQTTVIIAGNSYEFRASGRVLLFAGYTVLYMEAADEDEAEEDNPSLLNVSTANRLAALKDGFDKKQHFTTPPPRFTEASIVRTLEQKGIGRPSTYASIISTIVDREYIEIKEKRMFPTELGRIVNQLLVQNFPNVFDVKFTATMEEGLDTIESGNADWIAVLTQFYDKFKQELAKAEKSFNAELTVDTPCPECGKSLTIKYGKNGPFIACSGYPECKFTSDFIRTDDGKIEFIARKGPEATGIKCEKCGAEMVIKPSKYGEILACSAYPECKNIKNFVRTAEGIKILNTGEGLGQKCPECGDGDLILKSGKNGQFAACSNYPKCKYTASVKADSEGNLTITKNTVETMGVCPNCGKPMIVKKSFRGPFLACSGYPACKTTKSMKAAIKEAENGGVAESESDTPKAKAPAKPKTTAKSKTETAKKATPAKKATAKDDATKTSAKKATVKKTTTKKGTDKDK